MALAKDQITLINVNDGYVGNDGKTYVLNILGGQRSITYNEVGASPSPSPSAFSFELLVNGASVTPTSRSWSATGHLSGTSTAATFTPTYATSFNSSYSNAINLTVVYGGISIKAAAPIAVTRVGEVRYTWIKYADTVEGVGISDSPVGKKYIGIAANKTSSTESSNPVDYTWSLFEGPQGIQGATGERGPIGPTGVGVSSVVEYYLASPLATGVTTSTSGWTTTIQTMDSTKKYLWNYETINFSNGTSSNTVPVIIGNYSENGADGTPGRSLLTITEYYLASASSSGVTRATSGWTTTMQATTPSLPYLWNYEKLDWSSGTTPTYVEPILIGIHGEQGPQGPQGPAGRSITSVDVQYYLSTSATSLAGGSWSTTAPTWVDGRFMWSKTVTTYSTGSPTESTPVCITGAKGATGSTGSTGATGRGVSSIVEEFYLSTSKTTQTGGSWSTTMPTWSSGKYVWTRSKITYTSGTPATDYTTPLVSSEWEAVNEIQVGGRNLLLKSDTPVTNSSYPTQTYNLTEKMSASKTYTIRLWGTLGAGKTNFTPYLNGGSISLGAMANNGDGTFSLTFVGKDSGVTTGDFINIYPMPSGTVVGSTIDRIKLEVGNKATDWTPAPEDDQQYVNDTVNQLSQQLNSAIEQSSTNIRTEISEQYYTKGQAGQLVSSINTEFEQTKTAFNFQFNQMTKNINDIQAGNDAEFTDIRKHIRFEDGNIILGESTNNVTLKIENNQIGFYVGGVKVSYWLVDETGANPPKFYVTDGEFLNSLRLGNFAWTPRNNGNLSFGKVV